MSARRSLIATDKAALMLVLVPYLLGKGDVSVEEAAAEFDVTPVLMRQMVRTLPFVGRPGDSVYTALDNDLFGIDWDLFDNDDRIVITNTVGLERAPKLSAREAAALLAGLQLARSLPGVAESDVVAGLISKLSRGAARTPADVVVAPARVDDVRSTVAAALKAGVAVSFTYQAPDSSPTTRTVDPVTVLIANGEWYLQGWCHLRQGMRTFHLDRVSEPRLTDIAVTHRDDPVPELFAPSETDTVVRVRFDAVVAPLIGDYLHGAEIEWAGSTATARVRVADAQSLKRLAARRGGAVEILDPPSARSAAASWARAGLAQYAATDPIH